MQEDSGHEQHERRWKCALTKCLPKTHLADRITAKGWCAPHAVPREVALAIIFAEKGKKSERDECQHGGRHSAAKKKFSSGLAANVLVVAGAIVVDCLQAHFIVVPKIQEELYAKFAGQEHAASKRHPLKPHVFVLYHGERRK